MAKPFRVIDTGLRDGRRNIAFDQAMIALHKAGEIPDSIRFLRFPPTALIGRHQSLGQEVRLDHCRKNGIGIARRITGGGAIFFDEGQLGWELVFGRRTLAVSNLADLSRAICEAAALGLRKLGVDARYRPRNDIEVAGRKLSGTGGFFDGDTLFYQGTLLIETDMDDMVAEDPSILEALERASRAAASDATVLLEAESGAGKEIFARLIHRESPRAAGPFVAVNCAALPRELLEAELFGHSRGAFTGAHRDRKGHFQAADGGTLLLDEIGEMDVDLQARLLRVLKLVTALPPVSSCVI